MLTISDLTYRLGPRILFDSASAAIPDGARVGFVGRNGAGKSTLFRLLTGEISSESGAFSLPRHRRIGAVAQEAPSGPEPLVEVVLAADTERAALLREAETTTDPMRRAEIETRLVDIDAHSAPARAAAILHGLGFDAEAQLRPCSSFSGGWRMRVALAAVLFAEPDLLLLDEPTNYLDIEGTLWLYDFLGRYPHTALVISHDRELLDEAVDHILHLDRGKLTLYRGGYTSFDRQRREKMAQNNALRARQENERKHMQAFVDRFRAKATKARQAQSRLKRLEKMEPIAAMTDEAVLPFSLPGPERPLSPPIIAMEGVAAGYGERVVLKNLNLSIAPDDRIALLGQNGNGKSTFAKLLAGSLQPLSGAMARSGKLETAFFAQHQLDVLRINDTPFQHVAVLMPGAPEAKIRARAAQMGFPGQKADTPVSSLSGGERARLTMGLAAFHGPHLLILDEPTNHLDIDSRQALMEAINDYPGAVVLVSHDRFLVEACVDRLWLVANGSVKPFDGDLDDYRALVLGGADAGKPRADNQGNEQAERRRQAAERRQAQAPLRKRLEALEARIEKLTTAVNKVDAALAEGDAFAKNPAKAAELAKMRADAAEAIATAEEEWLEISSQLESGG
ncbi:ABC-F family ATP-binding cassette domain-containing protein [Camelimonas lactis]|uniref:ATP-binding cassette subfamily F protein 3 n=1 Tax=Camelimonas lactis TaxID=659006 RepID=A0A4R2GW80_9HYPH|nr:ABC-F family ATP-binding cassette domain-containing protein [Camelimonas lactis]TCO15291.1 ATP-binding cassette subfamily F protein 3 [Camelimonas lactis]